MKEGLRWIGSFVLVLGVHGAVIGVALGWTAPVAPYVPPPAAVMVELAPKPEAPEAPPNEAPPGPTLNEVLPEPDPPPPVEIKPPVAAEVVLPAPEPPPPVDLKPPPKKVEKPRPKQKPRPQVTAPQAAPEEAPVAAAPAPGVSSAPPSNTLPTWKGLLLGRLERFKRYPPEAERRRQEGVVYVRFTMSRDGRVLTARIEQSSHVASLDQEGLALLQRAQPLPPLPSDLPGETLELVVPIQFFLRH
ncbi:MAG: energy transducer TonB [Proteobacteria bacterium]|nr:energy transducer TonB [Pseudomonadota bacterium]